MIPVAVPNLAGNEAKYLLNCIESNFVSSIGPYVTRFESQVACMTGSAACAATSSGTTALQLALLAVGVKPGDVVVLPALTFIASANAISHCGASPWLMDVDSQTWTLDPDLLRRELRSCTVRKHGRVIHAETGRAVTAILPVYTLGLPADMDAINEVALEFGLPVIADAAAAVGATYKGRNLSDLAVLSVASFNGNKTFTCGGGGAIFGMNHKLVERARHLASTARCGSEYDHDDIGFNFRLTNLQAAVGMAQLEQSTSFLSKKQQIRAAYNTAVQEIPNVSAFPTTEFATSACWLSGVVLEHAVHAGEVIGSFKQRGIEARTFWKPIHLQTPYANAPRTSLEACENLWGRILTLPSSTSLTDADLGQVTAAIGEIFRK